MKKLMKTFLILMIVTIFVMLRHTYVYALSPSNETIYEGIDVSNYQGDINYEQVKEARNRNCIH